MVAPLVGAWIEIIALSWRLWYSLSLPSWERGLKSEVPGVYEADLDVAPLVGAWIEISTTPFNSAGGYCRSPRGSVD